VKSSGAKIVIVFEGRDTAGIFDRSWYNRAGVEPVMGYRTPDESEQFLELVPGVESQRITPAST